VVLPFAPASFVAALQLAAMEAAQAVGPPPAKPASPADAAAGEAGIGLPTMLPVMPEALAASPAVVFRPRSLRGPAANPAVAAAAEALLASCQARAQAATPPVAACVLEGAVGEEGMLKSSESTRSWSQVSPPAADVSLASEDVRPQRTASQPSSSPRRQPREVVSSTAAASTRDSLGSNRGRVASARSPSGRAGSERAASAGRERGSREPISRRIGGPAFAGGSQARSSSCGAQGGSHRPRASAPGLGAAEHREDDLAASRASARRSQPQVQRLEAQVAELAKRNAFLEAENADLRAELEAPRRLNDSRQGMEATWASLEAVVGAGQAMVWQPSSSSMAGAELTAEATSMSERAEIDRCRREIAERDALLLELQAEVKAQSQLVQALVEEARAGQLVTIASASQGTGGPRTGAASPGRRTVGRVGIQRVTGSSASGTSATGHGVVPGCPAGSALPRRPAQRAAPVPHGTASNGSLKASEASRERLPRPAATRRPSSPTGTRPVALEGMSPYC